MRGNRMVYRHSSDRNVPDLHRRGGTIISIPRHTCNLLYQFHAGVVAFSEEGIPAIQAGIRNFRDKKL
jgi:hypothetical protein